MISLTLSDKGKRSVNQDLILEQAAKDGSYLFAVIDGMGGYEHGELAAQVIAENIATYISTVDSINPFHIQKAINKSNLVIRQKNAVVSGRMGATIGGVLIKDEIVTYFLVGDVKVFHFRNNHLIFESTTHSLTTDLIASGSITEPTQLSKYKHVVTRCIQGDVKLSQAEFNSNHFQADTDVLIVCSDGVHDQLDSLQIEKMFFKAASTTDLFHHLKTRLTAEAIDNFSFGIISLNPNKEFHQITQSI